MIITDDFVLLNFPKTGSTFVRTLVKRAYQGEKNGAPRFQELFFPVLNQHGTYRQIPPAHRAKRILSVARNPLERFASEFRFRWWADHPEDFFEPELVSHFSHFPNLSFEEYARLRALQQDRLGLRLGPQSAAFVRMFFRDPEKILEASRSENFKTEKHISEIPEITFLRTEHLNEDLYRFLETYFNPEDIEFVLRHEKINVSKMSSSSVVWSPEVLAFMVERERLVFQLLAHHGLHYSAPGLGRILLQANHVPGMAH